MGRVLKTVELISNTLSQRTDLNPVLRKKMPHTYKTTSFNSLNSEIHGQRNNLLRGFRKLEQSVKILSCLILVIVLLSVLFVAVFLVYGKPNNKPNSFVSIGNESRFQVKGRLENNVQNMLPYERYSDHNSTHTDSQQEELSFDQVHGSPVEAHCGLGMVDGRIKDDQITASRYHDRYHQPKLARLYKPSRGWLAAVKGDWIQIELDQATLISGILTQGDYASNYWTMSYNVQYGNGSRFLDTIQDQNGDKIFDGNKDRLTIRSTYFVKPLFVRVIRIVVLTFNSMPAIRMELLTPTVLTTETVADLPPQTICRINNFSQLTID